MLKFSANLTMMFTETSSLLERYEVAAKSGFRYVECCFPYDVPADQIAKKCKELRLEHVLINTPLGPDPSTKGLACLSDKKPIFRESLQMAVDYAKALDCKRIHIMAGIEPHEFDHKQSEITYLENLTFASRELAKADLIGLIEPINSHTVPGYFLNNFEQAIGYLNQLPQNIRLQLDIFHLQMLQGCLDNSIRRYLPYTGHIQIAQAPHRHEPWSMGEMNYAYIFELLRSLHYDGFVGLEYTPKQGTVEGLKGMNEMLMEAERIEPISK